MKKLGRKHYYKKGTPLFEAWYANLNSMEIETVRMLVGMQNLRVAPCYP